MAKEFVENLTSTMKVEVYLNSQGFIVESGESVSGTKNVTFSGFSSSISAAEAINDVGSPALHNGVSSLMWLLTGNDDGNFNENVIMIKKEEIEDE